MNIKMKLLLFITFRCAHLRVFLIAKVHDLTLAMLIAVIQKFNIIRYLGKDLCKVV